jgi:UDP-2,3-diacylglucosamine pyrophosphatase LpxH
MLVIISDLHLGDGTTADSIPASAFYLFAKRLRQDAHFAAMNYRKDNPFGKYQPFEELDVLLMGDILDPLHSTRWLYSRTGGDETFVINEQGEKIYTPITEQSEPDYVRPWSNSQYSHFTDKLMEITLAILEHNKEGLQVFRDLAEGKLISFDDIDSEGNRISDPARQRPLKVNFYYMVGNHDWYYHLQGPVFDDIRKVIVERMGLCNSPFLPFPYDVGDERPESHARYSGWKTDIDDGNNDAAVIRDLLQQYNVFARHGDYYDMFNFDIELGRDHSTLGDAFTMEVCNRFPAQLLRSGLIEADDLKSIRMLRQMTNIRPALATPLWITGQLKQLSEDIARGQLKNIDDLEKIERAAEDNETILKKEWDKQTDIFLNLDFVRQKDKWGLDTVDKIQFAVGLSKIVSSQQLDDLVLLVQSKTGTGHDPSFAKFALGEPTFENDKVRYIVYGHTHHHETIPLDYDEGQGAQVYFNSGTWHTYFDLTRKKPQEKKFVPYKALTYITFFKKDEHGDQDFETWSGAYA